MRQVTVLIVALAATAQAHSVVHDSFLELSLRNEPARPHGSEAEAKPQDTHGTDPHATEAHTADAHAPAEHGEPAEEEAHPVHGHAAANDEHVADHVAHGTKAHGTGVNGPCPGNQSANSVAIGLLASVVLMPLVVYMTMCKAANGAVSELTFRMVDLTLSIFLAVLWFSASAGVLEHGFVRKAFPYAEEVFAVAQVALLYTVTMCIAYHFRENKYYLITFCGCAGHYIAFAAIKAVGESQHVAGTLVNKEASAYASFGFCFLVFAIFAGMSLICFVTWRRYIKDEELHLAIEELELDIVGLVLSFAIMQALRHMLTGHYPAQAHLFLQSQMAAFTDEVALGDGSLDNAPHVQHTVGQRMFMLMFAIGLTFLCCVSLNILEEAKEKSKYWAHKAYHVVQVVLVMCVAWAYLLWGEWQFYETFFHGDKMFGKMVFAVIATFLCLLLITGLAFATEERFSNAKGYADLCVMAASLVTAWSWEHCFHTAIGVIAEQYQVGYGGMVPKIIIALLIPLVILPGYMMFLKPIVVEIDERVHEEERMSLSTHLAEVMYTEPEAAEGQGETAANNTAVVA